jgi:endoglucanase
MNAARGAWNWSLKNPDILYRQPEDINTDAYGDRNLQDEWFWAGIEMALFEGVSLPTIPEDLEFGTQTWGNVATLGL